MVKELTDLGLVGIELGRHKRSFDRGHLALAEK
jgi:hypothetical protein